MLTMSNQLNALAAKAAAELEHLDRMQAMAEEPDLFDLDLGRSNTVSLGPALTRLRMLELETQRCRDELIQLWPETGESMRKLAEITGLARQTIVKKLEGAGVAPVGERHIDE